MAAVARPRRRARRRATAAVLAALFLLGAASAWRLKPLTAPAGTTFELARVSRGEVVKTLMVDGNLESADNLDVVCKLPGGGTIVWIVPDGTQVQPGDELVRFDGYALEDRVTQQTIALADARAAALAARRELSAATISVVEYVEGTFVGEKQQCEANVALAKSNLRAAEHALKAAERLARRGFVAPVHRQAAQFGLVSARHALAIALRAQDVLVRYHRPKLETELESRRGAAEAALAAAEARFQLEQNRLERLQAQLAQASIRAPQAGMVIYANDPDRGAAAEQTAQIEEGAHVRERQVVLRLPNLQQMQAQCLVHESLLAWVRPGIAAHLTVHGHELAGVVDSVATQPARSKRREAHIKNYTTIVRIAGLCQGLRPGETAEIELVLDHRSDVLTAPLAAVAQQGREYFAWVETQSGQAERHRIDLGTVEGELAEIRHGLAEGDALVLHPRDVLDEARRDDGPEPVDVAKRFGAAPVDYTANPAADVLTPLGGAGVGGGE